MFFENVDLLEDSSCPSYVSVLRRRRYPRPIPPRKTTFALPSQSELETELKHCLIINSC